MLCTSLSDTHGDSNVTIDNAPSGAWLEGFAAANGAGTPYRSIHDQIVLSIAMPTAFATIFEKGKAIGFGLAVYERRAIGLFDIVVAPSNRGRGKGRALTNALLQWGRQMGAQNAYLQVREQNEEARKLYAGFGFQEAYRYHYRVRNSTIPAAV